MPHIFCLGDSITYGYGLEMSGWCDLLRRHAERLDAVNPDSYSLTYNLGIPGEATDGLAKRFASEVGARLGSKAVEEMFFLFQYGANDACYFPGEERFRVAKEDYVANLRSALSLARNQGGTSFLLNITPVIEEAAASPQRPDKRRLNDYVREYNAGLVGLAEEEKAGLIDVHSEFMKNDPALLLSDDGLHPNEEGHRLIFELVKNALPFP